MQAVQREIAEQLKVQPPFADHAALEAEVARRVSFIQDCLVNSGLKTLVLGISGGVDSLSMGEGIGTPLVHLNRTAQRIINWRFVMPDSSRPGFGRYLYFPTQNHLTICKPKTQLDENYSAVREFIAQQMRREEERKSRS